VDFRPVLAGEVHIGQDVGFGRHRHRSNCDFLDQSMSPDRSLTLSV
jgi:hypothetical protein